MQNSKQKIHKHYHVLCFLLLALIFVSGVRVSVAEDEGAGPTQETMLMFVGEERPTVTVASRQPEEPAAAPAMVLVINREEIDTHGYQTLAQGLAAQPGFNMAVRGRGTASYLRGLPDSVLFLYDGVPMTTDVTRELGVLDREISLDAIDRVEISYGPGSILWGADAFAGVVNIVPLRGRQSSGGELSLGGGSDDLKNITATWGTSKRQWDLFLAMAGSREKYHSQDYIIEKSAGDSVSGSVDPSDYGEVVGTFNYGNWLRLTGRWSDFTRSYTMKNVSGNLSWSGEKAAPVNFLKATFSKVVGPSHYTMTGFLQEIDYRVQDADLMREQRSSMNHVELLWDRRLFSRGLLTVGGSWRKNMVRGAVVRDGFLPDFLAPSFPFFVPQVQQEDFDTERTAVFFQTRYQWGKTEWWAGGRLDKQNQYGGTQSYSLGFNWLLSDTLRLKSSFGNAFRSPYSSQIFDDQELDPESILTTSVQLAWQANDQSGLELTLFQSSLEDHRTEDPYGGLSEASGQKSQGVELAGRLGLGPALEMDTSLTVMAQQSSEEQFRNLQFSFIRPDGTQVFVFDEWSKPFDQGPQWLANIGIRWKLGMDHSVMINGRISDRLHYSYEKGSVQGSYYQPLLVDLTYRRPGFNPEHDSLTFSVTNLMDQNYQVPDTFGPTDGPSLKASLAWKYRF